MISTTHRSDQLNAGPKRPELGIWGYALGYFLCYAPYSALTSATASGLLPGMTRRLSGFEILPVSAMTSLVGMTTFLTLMGWWRFAGQREFLGLRLPVPGRWTLLSGLCSSVILATTTLAYTFKGISIVFMMLLMRGGVLIIAPVVDFLSRRKVRWFSWVALALSLLSLLAAFTETRGYALPLEAGVVVGLYLLGYFIRLRFMSKLAKSDDPNATTRYFVEEQLVAAPAVLVFLALWALWGSGRGSDNLRIGFTSFLTSPQLPVAVIIGLLSQGTAIFGGLILLDRRENTFCVPVNRASSVLAGVVATCAMSVLLGQEPLTPHEIVGAGLIIAAILVLTLPTALKKRAPSA